MLHEAPIGEDMQRLLSGDQVAPIGRENKEQFGLMLQLDIVFEQFGEVFNGEDIKESLILRIHLMRFTRIHGSCFTRASPLERCFKALTS